MMSAIGMWMHTQIRVLQRAITKVTFAALSLSWCQPGWRGFLTKRHKAKKQGNSYMYLFRWYSLLSKDFITKTWVLSMELFASCCQNWHKLFSSGAIFVPQSMKFGSKLTGNGALYYDHRQLGIRNASRHKNAKKDINVPSPFEGKEKISWVQG